MKWTNLLQNKCPKCGAGITQDSLLWRCDLYGEGKFFGCDFQISNQKLSDLKTKLGNRSFYNGISGDNSDALNNMGHKMVSQDFQDSPYLNG